MKIQVILPILGFLAVAFGANEIGTDKPEVVIIGGGVAGVAAASKLVANDFPVTILEAENRLGGRIHSVPFENGYVDVGAEWILSKNDNAAYEVLKNNDGMMAEMDFNFTFFQSNRKPVDQELAMTLFTVYETLMTLNETKTAPDRANVGYYLIMAYNATIHKLYEGEPEKLRTAFMALETFERFTTADTGSENWFTPSLATTYEESDDEFVFQIKFPHGMKVLIDELLKNFPNKEKIHLKKVVKNIKYGGEKVEVICTDGFTIQAPHVIFTPSLGVLKADQKNGNAMFVPPLNEAKQNAITYLGFGNVVKVMVHFPTRWWPENDNSGFTFIWTYEDRELLPVEFPTDNKGNSWAKDMMGVFPIHGQPNLLSVWFSGKYIKQIEQATDEEVIKGIMFVFDKFIGDQYKLVQPDKIFRENWHKNPNFRGSFAYDTVDSRIRKLDMEKLSIPMVGNDGKPKVLFAGEATSNKYYGTIHGAIESGFREADRLINLYNKP